VCTGRRRSLSTRNAAEPASSPPHPYCVLTSVTQQQNRANWQILGISGELFQSFIDVSCGIDGCNFFRRVNAFHFTAKPVDAYLKTLLQSCQNTVIERRDCRSLTRLSIAVGNSHAPGAVHYHSDDVLL